MIKIKKIKEFEYVEIKTPIYFKKQINENSCEYGRINDIGIIIIEITKNKNEIEYVLNAKKIDNFENFGYYLKKEIHCEEEEFLKIMENFKKFVNKIN